MSTVPTNYPASLDTFSIPSSPGTTNLSDAGSGTRNHPSHHRDMGDAIMALEANAALLTHDHSGGSGGFTTTRLTQINTHQGADTDSAVSALHHTIGSGANQASAGNHTHTSDSRLTGSTSGRYYSNINQWTNNQANDIAWFGLSVRTTPLITWATYGAGHKFTLNRAGIWNVTATIRIPPGNTFGEGYVGVQVNGGIATADGGPFSAITKTFNLSYTDYVNVGDEISISIFQSSGQSLLTQAGGGGWQNISLTWLHD